MLVLPQAQYYEKKEKEKEKVTRQADRFSRGIAKEILFRKEFPIFFKSKLREMQKKKVAQ